MSQSFSAWHVCISHNIKIECARGSDSSNMDMDCLDDTLGHLGKLRSRLGSVETKVRQQWKGISEELCRQEMYIMQHKKDIEITNSSLKTARKRVCELEGKLDVQETELHSLCEYSEARDKKSILIKTMTSTLSCLRDAEDHLAEIDKPDSLMRTIDSAYENIEYSCGQKQTPET
eukprot:204365_1